MPPARARGKATDGCAEKAVRAPRLSCVDRPCIRHAGAGVGAGVCGAAHGPHFVVVDEVVSIELAIRPPSYFGGAALATHNTGLLPACLGTHPSFRVTFILVDRLSL